MEVKNTEQATATEQTVATKVETIRERLVREEREAQERRVAEMRAEREARDRAAKEMEAERRRAEAERKAKAEADAKRRAEQAAADAAARKERNAALRAKEIERLEKAYVLFERAANFLDELDAAEREGLNMGTTYRSEVEKLRQAVTYSRDTARQYLINPAERFRYLRIDD